MLQCSRLAAVTTGFIKAAVGTQLPRALTVPQHKAAALSAISRGHVAATHTCRAFSSKLAQAPAAASSEGRDVEGARRALALAQAVCFDVDSTVCTEEGIDVLAEFCGAAEAVAALTNQAMGGSMLFQDAIKVRYQHFCTTLANATQAGLYITSASHTAHWAANTTGLP
jgi:hypothetical protein